MALKFQPKAGDVVICNFKGLIEPEMIKIRPVIVISKHPHHPKLVTIIPLSTTEPKPLRDYHYAMPSNPLPDKQIQCWAKCDMIYTVSIERLDRYKTKDLTGKRIYVVPKVDHNCFKIIQNMLVLALNITHNKKVP